MAFLARALFENTWFDRVTFCPKDLRNIVIIILQRIEYENKHAEIYLVTCSFTRRKPRLRNKINMNIIKTPNNPMCNRLNRMVKLMIVKIQLKVMTCYMFRNPSLRLRHGVWRLQLIHRQCSLAACSKPSHSDNTGQPQRKPSFQQFRRQRVGRLISQHG